MKKKKTPKSPQHFSASEEERILVSGFNLYAV